jgi:hypothetical protein
MCGWMPAPTATPSLALFLCYAIVIISNTDDTVNAIIIIIIIHIISSANSTQTYSFSLAMTSLMCRRGVAQQHTILVN